MTLDPTASVILINYNYGRFLHEAIGSAIGQTCPETEVIVVDDGSTDDSRAVITSFGDRVRAVFKNNGGMDTAMNAGFQASRGRVVIFLDADDVLLPSAVESALSRFRDLAVTKVHWPLWEIDRDGRKTGRLIPVAPLPDGHLREQVVREGPLSPSCQGPPTSGNAFSREFLERALPIPVAFRRHGEVYLTALAPVFGTAGMVREPQGCYRVHGSNDYAVKPSAEKVRRNLGLYDPLCVALGRSLAGLGIPSSPGAWKEGNSHYSWLVTLEAALREVAAAVPEGESFILVDENQWSFGGESPSFEGRRVVPFLERNGQYWGKPDDDDTAVRELDRLRGAGAAFLVFAWPAFWWLEHYRGLSCHLHDTARRVVENGRIIVFDLRP
jgi:hypothetical protein